MSHLSKPKKNFPEILIIKFGREHTGAFDVSKVPQNEILISGEDPVNLVLKRFPWLERTSRILLIRIGSLSGTAKLINLQLSSRHRLLLIRNNLIHIFGGKRSEQRRRGRISLKRPREPVQFRGNVIILLCGRG